MEKSNTNKIAIASGFRNEDVGIIKNTVAKGTTDQELALFLFTAREAKLSPLLKEIWCYRDAKSNLIIFAGRDGFLKSAQSNPVFNGIRSSEVRENDDFTIDIANGKITHSKNIKNPGKILGAYAIAFRKDCESTIEYVEFSAYDKGYSAWKSHPADMIKKVAETHALKKAFGISALQSEYDFEVNNDRVYPIDTETIIEGSTIAYISKLLNGSSFDEDQRTAIENELGSMLSSRAEEVIEDLKMNQLNPIKDGNSYQQGDILNELKNIDHE